MHHPEHRWEEICATTDGTPEACLAAIKALLEHGETEAAQAGAAAAFRLFPEHAEIAREAADAAERRADWASAAAAWQAARAANPADLDTTRSLAECLIKALRPHDAEAVLNETLASPGADRNSPGFRNLQVQHARVAELRGDFQTSRDRWQALLDQAPDDPRPKRALRELAALRLPELTGNKLRNTAADETQAASANLMLQFESLGSTCEFGLVQRHFKAEPLGLLRWVTIRLPHLCSALDTEFAGIGEPRFTRMHVSDGGEFHTSDTRYELAMHTFMRDTGQDREKLEAQLRRRMRFLRDKLLEDLRAGEKIFVYRLKNAATDQELFRVVALLRAYNPANRLLLMRMLPHGETGEPAQEIAPGVLLGAIANGRKPVKGTGWAIDHAFWLQTCEAAVTKLKPDAAAAA